MLQRAMHETSDHMPLWKHLEELRWVFFRCLCTLLVGTLVGMFFTNPIYRALLFPVREYLAPTLRAEHFTGGAPPPSGFELSATTPTAAPDARESRMLTNEPGTIEELLRRHGEAIAALEARLALLDPLGGAEAGTPRLQIVYTSPTDPFMIKLKVAFLGGVVLAVVPMAFFIWAFIAPGLLPEERVQVGRALRTGTLLFFAGALFGYTFLPLGIPALMKFSATGVAQFWPLQVYINFCIRVILSFAIAFELPVVLGILVRLNLLDVQGLRRGRPYAWIAILFVAALLTPPDVFSQAALAIPMMILYEIAIIAGRRQQRRRNDESETEIKMEN